MRPSFDPPSSHSRNRRRACAGEAARDVTGQDRRGECGRGTALVGPGRRPGCSWCRPPLRDRLDSSRGAPRSVSWSRQAAGRGQPLGATPWRSASGRACWSVASWPAFAARPSARARPWPPPTPAHGCAPTHRARARGSQVGWPRISSPMSSSCRPRQINDDVIARDVHHPSGRHRGGLDQLRCCRDRAAPADAARLSGVFPKRPRRRY